MTSRKLIRSSLFACLCLSACVMARQLARQSVNIALGAATFGALIAFYEHRTFANAVLLGINPFDQFGVELGKDIARQLSEGEDQAELDPSTRALIERAGL